eukprot:Hpha_TRINITY_DN15644_c1_g1::TRINITY_DN15644_c1_g1_i1::g.97588::m.97588
MEQGARRGMWAAAASLLVGLGGVGGQFTTSSSPEQMGLGGGVPLTIIGQAFSGDPFMGANRVYVGGVECAVDDAFTREFRLVCPRAPPYSKDAFSALPLGVRSSAESVSNQITVQVDGRWVIRNPISLSYERGKTPWLEGIGHAAVEGSTMHFRGQLMSRNPAEYSVEIGDVRCSVLDALHDKEIKDVAHEVGDERRWSCLMTEQEGGYYTAKVTIEPDLMTNDLSSASAEAGSALPSQRHLPDLFKMNSLGEPYMVAHYPNVRTVQPDYGSPNGGTLLTLHGSGFSLTGNTQVTVGGEPCPIVASNAIEILCTVPKRIAQNTVG